MNDNETIKNDFWIQHEHANSYQNSWGIMMFNQTYEFNTSSINLFIHLDFYHNGSLRCYYAPTIKMYFKRERNQTYSKIYFIDDNGNESNKFTLNSYKAIGTNLTITITSG